MDERKRPPQAHTPRAKPRSGLGVACREAQADGVPCSDLGAQCGECDRALARREQDRPASTAQPGSDDA